MGKIWTILELINEASMYFKNQGIATARLDAELLLAHCLSQERIGLYLNFDHPVTEEQLAGFRELVRRRAKREPVAYIIGWKEFWSLKIKVKSGVLIPRPETEVLVEEAIKILKPRAEQLKVLELGTGSAAIVLALVKELSNISACAMDISQIALETARGNLEQYGLSDRVALVCGSSLFLFKQRELFDMVISNPPYIRSDDIPGLEPEIREYEPREALDGGADGLLFYRQWLAHLPGLLKKHGWVLLEMGAEQASAVSHILQSAGIYSNIKIINDYAGHQRAILAQKQ